MTTKKLTRKDFLKFAGATVAAVPAIRLVGRSGDFEFFESERHYGGFTIRKQAGSGPFPFETNADYERFHEYNHCFGQDTWNKAYQAKRQAEGSQLDNALAKRAAGIPGWNRFEHELRDSAWWLYRNGGSNWSGWDEAPELSPKAETEGFTVAEMTNYIKKASLFLGASEVGIIEAHENYFYQTLGRNPEQNRPLVFKDVPHPINNPEAPEVVIPTSMNRIIVFALEMDYDAFTTGGVNKVTGAAVGRGYSTMAWVAGNVADYIRRLGYQAFAMGNDTGLSIPMAIAAGLGEDSRMGLLVTPKYGPRVRISKVITDMPLNVDSPISFGVKEFCEACGKCAEYCPSACIPNLDELPTTSFKPFDTNNTSGIKKWQVRQKECHTYWNTAGVGCGNCVSVCPFNKPEGWLHEATRIMVGAKSGSIDKLMLNLDEMSGYPSGLGEEVNGDLIDYWWNDKEDYIHRKG